MKKITAINKMKLIEELIEDLKKSGYNVFCINNEKIVMENPKLKLINTKKSYKDTSSLQIGYGGVSHPQTNVPYDYEIYL